MGTRANRVRPRRRNRNRRCASAIASAVGVAALLLGWISMGTVSSTTTRSAHAPAEQPLTSTAAPATPDSVVAVPSPPLPVETPSTTDPLPLPSTTDPVPLPTTTPPPTSTPPPPTSTPPPSYTPTPIPAPIRTGQPGVDALNQRFTSSNGLSSSYHIFGAGVRQPAGLVLQFHGDGASEFKNPNDSWSLGGSNGIVANARAKGYITVAALTPDSSTMTWWEKGEENAVWVRDLLAKLKSTYAIDNNRIYLVGYSGGTSLITLYYLPKYSSTISGGGAILFGGGGAPWGSTNFSASFKANFTMHWYTGADDTEANSDEGYDALADAQEGLDWYTEQGLRTSHTWPAGVDHDLDGRFGPVVGQQLK